MTPCRVRLSQSFAPLSRCTRSNGRSRFFGRRDCQPSKTYRHRTRRCRSRQRSFCVTGSQAAKKPGRPGTADGPIDGALAGNLATVDAVELVMQRDGKRSTTSISRRQLPGFQCRPQPSRSRASTLRCQKVRPAAPQELRLINPPTLAPSQASRRVTPGGARLSGQSW